VCVTPAVGDDIPIFIVFKAMGVESDQEICALVGGLIVTSGAVHYCLVAMTLVWCPVVCAQVGTEQDVQEQLYLSLVECASHSVEPCLQRNRFNVCLSCVTVAARCVAGCIPEPGPGVHREEDPVQESFARTRVPERYCALPLLYWL
jgi:hypothetical protein